MKYTALAIFLLCITYTQCTQPEPPIWADQWQQDFEDYWIINDQEVQSSGIYYYDYTNNKQRVYRQNSQADGICSTLTDKQESCSQYVDQGKRFIYFEEQNDCCFCCGASNGCGLIFPEWMSFAKYDGVDAIDDQFYNVWETRDGDDPVYTLYNSDTNIQSAIYRPGNQELIIYDQNSYQDYLSNPDIVNLPSVCSMNNICAGDCEGFRTINIEVVE